MNVGSAVDTANTKTTGTATMNYYVKKINKLQCTIKCKQTLIG